MSALGGEAAEGQAAVQPASDGKRRWLLLALVVLGQVMIAMDYSIASVALPSIGRGLAIGAVTVQWVLSAAALARGGFLIVGGRLADVYGQKRCFIIGVAGFTAGTLASGLAGGIGVLIAARAVQGLAAALCFPAMLSLITLNFPSGPDRFRALSISTTALFLSVPVGTIIAGLLIDAIGWHGAFLLNVPIGLFVLTAAPRIIPQPPRRDDTRQAIDFVGAALVTIGLVALVWSLSQLIGHWRSASGAAFLTFGGGVLVLGSFVLLQRVSVAPLVASELLHSPNFLSSVVIVSLASVGATGLMTLAAISFQQALAFTPLDTGLALLPYGLMAVLVSTATPLFARRLLATPRASLVLFMLVLCACHAMAILTASASAAAARWGLLAALTVAPLATVPAMNIGMVAGLNGVAAHHQGMATALFQTVTLVTLAIAVAVMITASDFMPQHGAAAPSFAGFVPGYGVGAGLSLLGVAVILLTFRHAARRP